jgi:hypothetical protein
MTQQQMKDQILATLSKRSCTTDAQLVSSCVTQRSDQQVFETVCWKLLENGQVYSDDNDGFGPFVYWLAR